MPAMLGMPMAALKREGLCTRQSSGLAALRYQNRLAGIGGVLCCSAQFPAYKNTEFRRG
jgi:hypothetical protein